MTKELLPKDFIIPDFGLLFPSVDDSSSLLVRCRRIDYSASVLSRAVEDCNAQVLNLNVTSINPGSDDLVVSMRVNHRNPESIARSLMRYGYEVIETRSSSAIAADSMRRRANEVLRLLDV